MNLFKMLGNLGNLSKIQEEMQAAAEEMSKLVYEGSAGGGMVTVKVSGKQEVLACTIDPKLVEENEREMIEELVISAMNEALTECKRQTTEGMQKRITEKLNMPELSSMIGQFLPK